MKKTSSIEANSIKKIKVTDVCPAYYGAIENIDGNELVVIFIEKNTPLPCSVSKSYFTEYENQDSINIRITESATFEDNPDFVNILQEKVIQLPPISPAGYEIQVTFNVDNNGVFHASILNVKSGERSDITIAGIESNLTDQFTVNDEVQEVGSKYGSKSIGIDLGNLYSAISSINEHGIPTIIRNSEGQNRTPSCIEINGDEVTVGEIAIKGLGWNDNILSRFINALGTSEIYKVDGKEFTPTQCTAFVLKKLLQDAKDEIGDVGEAVITIPTNFTYNARIEMLAAAKQTGLNVNKLLEEPTAAAIYYAFKGGVELKGHFAVYDLGGVTFDISIIKVDQQNIKVLASEGVQKLGGDDFDTILQKLVCKKFKDEHDEVLDSQDYTKTDAEEDKKSLSKRENINVRIHRKNLMITRAEFEENISSLVTQTEMVSKMILEEQSLRPGDLKAVFLVGGSTRVPLVQKTVERVFKQEPTKSVNVDEAVCLGASLYAAFKGDQSNLTRLQKASIAKITQNQDDDSSEIDKWLVD